MMATLPSYVHILFAGFGEEFDPAVERTEMERGVPKQRLINTSVLVEVSASLLFDSEADTEAFDIWYFETIQRIGWFQMTQPRTGQTITARFKGGKIGKLAPRSPRMDRFTRTGITIEYQR
jgi:hypothetical protein